MSAEPWKKCGTCKQPIAYGQKYWKCSVSSCNRARFQLAFCRLACWDAHVPVMNHRSAWADEGVAPKGPEPEAKGFAALPAANPSPTPHTAQVPRPSAHDSNNRRRLARSEPTAAKADLDILIVASKLKKYIREQSGMNTSADVLEVLSNEVRALADDAIREARAEGRRTVKARDFR